jgi:hypothetical protein
MRFAARWAGYAAAVWAALFALVSLYWAAGGTAGADTIGDAITDPALAREAGMVAFLWATVLLKALAAALALALVQPWGRLVPRPLVVAGGWVAASIMILWGGALWIQHGLMEAGVVGMPESMDSTAIRWHVALWDPFWLVGGLLFLAATRYFQTHSRAAPAIHQTRTGVSINE